MALLEHEAKELFHVSTGLFYSQAPCSDQLRFGVRAAIRVSAQVSSKDIALSISQQWGGGGAGGLQQPRAQQSSLPPSNQRDRGQRSRVKPVSHPSWWIGLCWISSHDTLHLRGRPQGGVTQQVNISPCCGWPRKQTQLNTQTPLLLQEGFRNKLDITHFCKHSL